MKGLAVRNRFCHVTIRHCCANLIIESQFDYYFIHMCDCDNYLTHNVIIK